MEKIIAHIRPIDWTFGDVYGIEFRLSCSNPSVHINWGDGKSDTYRGSEIRTRHIYPKDPSKLFVVEASIQSDRIDYVNPTGGDCKYELIDFSEAPSIVEIYAQCTEEVVIDNPNLRFLDLSISLGESYDLSKCSDLRDITFHSDGACKSLDLSYCHKLQTLSCNGFWNPNLRKITVANDAPLYKLDITGHNIFPSCLAALHRIVERNNGYIIGEFEKGSLG